MKFNNQFYKSLSFWLGLLTMVGLIADFFMHRTFSNASWFSTVVMFGLFFNSLFQKKEKKSSR